MNFCAFRIGFWVTATFLLGWRFNILLHTAWCMDFFPPHSVIIWSHLPPTATGGGVGTRCCVFQAQHDWDSPATAANSFSLCVMLWPMADLEHWEGERCFLSHVFPPASAFLSVRSYGWSQGWSAGQGKGHLLSSALAPVAAFLSAWHSGKSQGWSAGQGKVRFLTPAPLLSFCFSHCTALWEISGLECQAGEGALSYTCTLPSCCFPHCMALLTITGLDCWVGEGVLGYICVPRYICVPPLATASLPMWCSRQLQGWSAGQGKYTFPHLCASPSCHLSLCRAPADLLGRGVAHSFSCVILGYSPWALPNCSPGVLA